MGSNHSSEDNLKCFFDFGENIKIELDSFNFHEGSQATGNISFTVVKKCPAVKINILIEGYENIFWEKKVTKTKGYGRAKRRVTKLQGVGDKKKTVTSRAFVMETHEDFEPENYTYPISFQIPTNIVGTYASSNTTGPDIKCSSTYMVYAEVNANKSSNKLLGRGGCPIIIMQRPRNPLTTNVEMKLNTPLKSFFCLSKGTFHGLFTFEKNIVCMDEEVWMKCILDNSESSLSVNKVTCSLIRVLTLNTAKGESKVLTSTIIKQVLGGVKGKEKSEEKTIELDLNQAKDDGTPHSLQGSLGEFSGKLQQSCTGELIRCHYELQMKAEFSGMRCFEEDPKCDIPIEVIASEKVILFQPEIFAAGFGGGEHDGTMMPTMVQDPAMGPVGTHAPIVGQDVAYKGASSGM